MNPVELRKAERRFVRGESTVTALAGVSLRVARGEFVALVGPSGCGKSTLLNLVSGVDRADGGTVLVAGVDLGRAREDELVALRRRALGIVFQAFHLLPNLSAAENVALPLALAGRRDPARVAELLERVGLAARAGQRVAELSGGEQQRVAVARALAHRPAVVVADEPTGNLDSASGARVLALLTELVRADGAALLLATHDRGVAAAADRVVSMRDGAIEADGA